MKNEVRLIGYNFLILYEGVEYAVSTDVCLSVHLYDGSIEPDPYDAGHTPMEIKEFVEDEFMNGRAIGLD